MKVNVSFHPPSVPTFSTQTVMFQPHTLPKLIEEPGRRGNEGSAGAAVMCRPSLLDIVDVKNHELAA